MPKTVNAKAWPTKRFFIDMLTNDISVEDAILDLIDNSIDSLIRTKKIDLTDKLLFSRVQSRSANLPTIDVRIDGTHVSVKDSCGGIRTKDALETVFRIGKKHPEERPGLSTYGIGMKRAVFKIGNSFTVKSATETESFEAGISDISEWEKDDSEPAWVVPLVKLPVISKEAHTTTVTIRNLRSEIEMRLKDRNGFLKSVRESIGTTYSLFLDKYVSISLDGTAVAARDIPWGESIGVKPGVERFKVPDTAVRVDLYVGLLPRPQWKFNQAGWYIVCNGRLVAAAEKTQMTGWGLWFPQYVTKYRGFVGIVFFTSKRPEQLPWRTTKKGVNTDSLAFQFASQRMYTAARPVLNFLNAMYPNEEPESALQQRQAANTLAKADVRSMFKVSAGGFAVAKAKQKKADEEVIKFFAPPRDIKRVKRQLGKPGLSNGEVGRETFNYYLKMECPE